MQNLIPETGFIRLSTILKIIPVGRTTWWAGVKSGRFPKPVKLGQRITAWNAEDIRTLIEKTTTAPATSKSPISVKREERQHA
jgi:predicted DNA-binding transcriptional regulator AlpA